MDIIGSELPDGPLSEEMLKMQDELQRVIQKIAYPDTFPALINMPASERVYLSGFFATLKATSPNNVFTYCKLPPDETSRIGVMIREIGQKRLENYSTQAAAWIRHIMYWYLDTHMCGPEEQYYHLPVSDEYILAFCRSLSPEKQIDTDTFSKEELWFLGSMVVIYDRVNELRYFLDLPNNPIPFIQSMINDVSNEIRRKIMEELKRIMSTYIMLFTEGAVPHATIA